MTPAGRWLEESLLTEGGRQALAEILRAVREEDPAGDAARYRRLKAALAAGMQVILCVGEKLEEREEGITGEIVFLRWARLTTSER